MPTPFQQKVYAFLKKVPKGKVISYKFLAQQLDTSARAIGGAMKRNPYKDVPWHRVIASDRSLGGFSGQWGENEPNVKRKRTMLESEGVVFDDDGYVKRCCLIERIEINELDSIVDDSTNTKLDSDDKVKKNSSQEEDITQKDLERAILDLVTLRGINKTCWPSEIPRKLRPSNWRPLMEPTRKATISLVKQNKINILQKGKVLSDVDNIRGPIRLKIREP